MGLLLDTHVWLRTTIGDARVSAAARTATESRRNDVFASAASAWELAMKFRLGKLALPLPPHEYVPTALARSGFRCMATSAAHATAVASLPDLHRDPFDRSLIAQALHENLTIVTVDPIVRAYAVPTVDAKRAEI